MTILKVLIILAEAYLLGSVSFSIVLSRLTQGSDVREKGSGNAGATNMARNYGWAAGLMTLGGDILKSALAMFIGHLLLGDAGLALAGCAATLGHCFPVFYGFKGGKGVSALAAVAIMIDWRVVALGLAIFLIVALLTKKVSPGSLTAAVVVPMLTVIFQKGLPKILLAIFCGLLVIYQHRANIRRLINGTEPDFHAAKK